MMDDAVVVTRQLGRAPRGRWRVVARCSHGYPYAIATAPLTQQGAPFPTLFYLTCPHLVAEVSRLESEGGVEGWRSRIRLDASFRNQVLDADAGYRRARAVEGGGVDPVPGLGTAGLRDPLAVKCLHAHVAAVLGGVADPIGAAVLGELGRECADRRCGKDG